ncbi:hypothetical protein U0070_008679 [Myodes glareolus]|uniref:Uncharacterized protein n=1 Tax=Myodes glareolus TaxID=447135 RepID=A0AAW0IAZ6_MYOGA
MERCVPFQRYNGGVESNAGLKGLDADSLVIEHTQVNKAPKMRDELTEQPDEAVHALPRHIDMILTEKEQTVPKPEEEVAQKKRTSQKKKNKKNKKLKKQKLTARE